MNRHEINLQSTIALARKVEHDNPWHLAAIAMKGHKVVGYGWNTYQTHPKSTAPYHRLHAEMDCILSSNRDHLPSATLYVARVGYDGRSEVLLASPCAWCRMMIVKAGIRKVYYTVDGSHYGIWDVKNDTETVVYTEGL
jgi:tRNA(Arg) A34 adenosine deaminase TadA